MEILSQFGFDIKLFLAQIVNFLIIAYLFKRFLYKPILAAINKRNDAIKKGMLDAEMATKSYEEAQKKADELLKKTGLEAEKILSEAKLQAQEMRDEMVKKTASDIEKMMEKTRDQIQLEQENFRKEAKDMALSLSESILANTIGNLFGKKESEELVKKGLAQIKNGKSAKN